MALAHKQGYNKKQEENRSKWKFLWQMRSSPHRCVICFLDSCLLLHQAAVQNKVKAKALGAAKSVQTPSRRSKNHPHSQGNDVKHVPSASVRLAAINERY